MRTFDNHPVAVWASIIFGLFSVATGVAGGWYFIMDERERSLEQNERLMEIRREQEKIRTELATQTTTLQSINTGQEVMRLSSDVRFDKIEEGHDRIVQSGSDSSLAMAIELGKVSVLCSDKRGD